MNWYTHPSYNSDFADWLKANGAESYLSTTSRVWDADRGRTTEMLYAMWSAAYNLGQKDADQLRRTLDIAQSMLTAKNETVINFTLFGRRSASKHEPHQPA